MAKGSRAVPQGSHPQNKFQAVFIGSSQQLSSSGSNVQSAAFSTDVSLIWVFSTTDVWMAVGANPTANTDGTSMFVPGGIRVPVGVEAGQKAAFKRVTTNGTVYITEGLA